MLEFLRETNYSTCGINRSLARSGCRLSSCSIAGSILSPPLLCSFRNSRGIYERNHDVILFLSFLDVCYKRFRSFEGLLMWNRLFDNGVVFDIVSFQKLLFRKVFLVFPGVSDVGIGKIVLFPLKSLEASD